MTAATFGEVISSYPTNQGVEDGFLVAAPTDLVARAGIKAPVFLSVGLAYAIGDPEADPDQWRIEVRNVLYLTASSFRAGDPDDRMRTDIRYAARSGNMLRVWAVLDGAGVTIMLPEDY